MNSGEQFGRIDGRLRLGFDSFDPRQLLVYGLLNDVFLAPAEARCREILRLEDVLCRGLLHRGASGIAVYTLNNGLQFADELGWCGAQARSGSMREAFLRMTQRVPQGRRTVGDLFPGAGGKPEQGQTTGSPASTEPPAAPTRGGLMPYDGSLQSLRAAFESLDRYLTVESESGQQAPRLAVLLPRAQTLFANRGSEQWHYLVSWFQKWSAPGFANASVLLFETDDLNLLPAELRDQRRAGVQLLHLGLPQNDEINWFVRTQAGGIETGSQSAARERLQVQRLLAGRSLREIGWLVGQARTLEQQPPGKLSLTAVQSILQVRAVWDDLLQPQELQKLETYVGSRVCGQHDAIAAILARLRATGGRLRQARRDGLREQLPAGVFFLAGPTGVGKTEVFRALCEHWKDVPARQISMSEYELDHQVTRLLGSPPSYVGDPRGELGQFLLDHPASMLLFDEFEKANERVLNVFLTLLEGNWTLGDGTRLDLSQCLIFFTSNAGAEKLAELSRQSTPVPREARLQAVKSGLKLTRTGKSLPDELIGRLMSRIIVFGGLTEEMANQIVRPRLTEIAARLRDLHGLQLDFVSQLPEIVRQLLTNDAGLGARDLVGRLRSIEEEALVVQAGDRELKSVRLQVESGELRVVPARR
jgi:MoxR-like ATPase